MLASASTSFSLPCHGCHVVLSFDGDLCTMGYECGSSGHVRPRLATVVKEKLESLISMLCAKSKHLDFYELIRMKRSE